MRTLGVLILLAALATLTPFCPAQSLPASGQPSYKGPPAQDVTTTSAGEVLSVERHNELVAKIADFNKLMPETSIDSPPPTPEQQIAGAAACQFFHSVEPELPQLDNLLKLSLGTMAFKAGFACGDAQTMFAGARTMWEVQKLSGKVDEPTAHAVAWSAIFVGNSQAAEKALAYLGQTTTNKTVSLWAKDMQPVARSSGKTLAGMKLTLMDGGSVDMASSKGKAALLYFWTPQDTSAEKEIDHLKGLYQKYQAAPLAMYSVYMGREGGAKAVSGQYAMPWPQAADGGALRKRFVLGESPLVVMLSAKGQVVWQGLPMQFDTIDWTTAFLLRQVQFESGQMPSSAPAAPVEQPPAATPTAPPAPAEKAPDAMQAAGTVGDAPALDDQGQAKLLRDKFLLQKKSGQYNNAKATLKELQEKYPNSVEARSTPSWKSF
jgi:hypothetical protein